MLFRKKNSMQSKTSNPVMLFWIAMLLFISFFSGFVIALRVTGVSSNSSVVVAKSLSDVGYFDEKLYTDVWSLLKNNYVDKKKIDDKKLFYGALQGMVAAVGDPYTTFFDPQASKDLNDELQGSFEGIGAEIGMKDNHLTIIAPLPSSPAEKAGLRAGDTILSIDGKDASALTLDEAVSQIRGKANTTVKLSIYHIDGKAPIDVTVTRQTITVPAVKEEEQDGIAIIHLYKFSADSEHEFISALREASAKPIKGLIVDLRNDPGGFLDQAVLIASAWVDTGQVVVREVYHDERLSKEYDAQPQFAAPKVPTVLLVNEGSASAAEILAGALQDYGKATLVGAKTYGKGSVQDLRSLADGSELKITISQWLTPHGRIINGEGITPDKVVPMTQDDYDKKLDPQLDAAKAIITKQ